MQCERVCPRRTFAASRGGCKPGTVRRVLSLSSRRGERGFSPASRARGCRRYQGRRACWPAAKRPDRATWVVPRLELFRPSHDKLMGRPFLFCPNVKITPRTFTRRFTLCRRNSPKDVYKRQLYELLVNLELINVGFQTHDQGSTSFSFVQFSRSCCAVAFP